MQSFFNQISNAIPGSHQERRRRQEPPLPFSDGVVKAQSCAHLQHAAVVPHLAGFCV